MSSSAICIFATTLSSPVILECRAAFAQLGDEIRFLANYIDASNYDYLSITADSISLGTDLVTTVSYYQVVAGSPAQIYTQTYTIEDAGGMVIDVRLCRTAGRFAAQLKWAGTSTWQPTIYGRCVSGTPVMTFGVGTGAVDSSNPTLFDDFTLWFNRDDCPDCALYCAQTELGVVASAYQIAMSGIADGTGCANCEALDGTYEVPTDSAHRLNACYYYLQVAFSCGSHTGTTTVRIGFNNGYAEVECEVYVNQTGQIWRALFRKTLTSPYDVCSFNSTDFPFYDHTGTNTTYCNASSAICTVTAA